MDREVKWTESASSDLEQIAAYIAQDSEFYAAAVIRDLVDAGRSLSRFAERGRVVPEYEDPAIRQLIVRGYRLVYRVEAPYVCARDFLEL